MIRLAWLLVVGLLLASIGLSAFAFGARVADRAVERGCAAAVAEFGPVPGSRCG